MARSLAWGRFTKSIDTGADPLTEALRQAGFIGAFDNKGVFGNHLDRLIFDGYGYEHILGSDSQVSSDFATMTWDQTAQRFEDKSGAEVFLTDFDRVAVIGMDTLLGNLVIDNIQGLEMFHIGGTPGQAGSNPGFQLGDIGGGVPHKILFGPGTKDCKLDLQTDKTFKEISLLNITEQQKRFISNQGVNNNIIVNNTVIYNPSEAGTIVKYDTEPVNPYLLRMNGSVAIWQTDVSVVNEAWFRDLNIALGGERWDGTNFIEAASRFTTPATIAGFPHIFQLNTVNRFFTDISALDDRVHERTDPTGVVIAESADFVNTSNVVTFPGGIGDVKNGMRISGATTEGIPDINDPGTTILRNINTTAGTAEMFNALTGVAVPATATFNGRAVTIDNSGAAGGSHDLDAFQEIFGSFEIMRGKNDVGVIRNASDGFTQFVAGGVPDQVSVDTKDKAEDEEDFDFIDFRASDSFEARTHSQTQPISSGAFYFYKA